MKSTGGAAAVPSDVGSTGGAVAVPSDVRSTGGAAAVPSDVSSTGGAVAVPSDVKSTGGAAAVPSDEASSKAPLSTPTGRGMASQDSEGEASPKAASQDSKGEASPQTQFSPAAQKTPVLQATLQDEAEVDSQRNAFLFLIGYPVQLDTRAKPLVDQILKELEERKGSDAPDEMWYIGDNMELLARTARMSKSNRNLLHHFFHIIASKLRVSSLFLPDDVALGDMRRHWSFLDNVINEQWMQDQLETVRMLFAQDIVQRIDFMKKGQIYDCTDFAPKRKEHKYSKSKETIAHRRRFFFTLH